MIQKTQHFRLSLAILFGSFLSLASVNPALGQVSANFNANVTSGCSPLVVQFTDLSTGNIHAWFWDFGNGNTSAFDDVIATYSTPGTYTVVLTVTDTVNNISSTRTETAYITVFEDPEADLQADTTSGCAPLTVNFTDLSTPGTGTLSNWLWDFGDGNVSTGPTATPTHTYTSAGSYTLTLVVTDDNGCADTRIYNDLITITEVANVDFSASPQTGCSAPLNVNFTSSVSPAGSYTYLWDFGDGNTSSAVNPTHTYTSNGDFPVSLTISDAVGCQEQVIKDNFVLINQPVADFQALNTSVCTGETVQFENLSTGADVFLWNFGDGNTSSAENPSHTYAVSGTYTVSLTATNSAGCSDFHGESNYIEVFVSPAPGFTASDNVGCNIPLFVTFTDNSIGNIVAWSWDFGNGNFSTGANPTTTYSTPGSFSVSLTVTTADGCQATETVPNYILLAEPDAEFNVSNQQGCVPLTSNFFDLSTSPTDPIVSWVWNFGDGTSSNAQFPNHTYTSPGVYTVSLTVTTQSGCQDTQIFQSVEAGTKPSVAFDAVPRVACVGENIAFSDLTTGGATEWFWNFGNGVVSNVQNPVAAYQDTGFYPVSLVVSFQGCEDTLVETNFIEIVGPLAAFVMTPTQACNPPTPVNFFDQSHSGTSYFWDFGDGNNSSQQNPSHTFTTVGTFTVRYVVTDSISGCTNDIAQDLTITNPLAAFSVNSQFGCAPLQVDFNNTSLNTANYYWDFGDGNNSTQANPSHVYGQPGVYDVMLIASDGACEDTLLRTALIEVAGPQVQFGVDSITGCAPLTTTFADSSIAYGGTTISSWQWDFGDGSFGSGPTPTHTYNTPGSYDVKLTILDSQGCLDSLTKLAYIQPTFPTANFISLDSISCPGSLVRFSNLSVGTGLSYVWDFGDGGSSNTANPIHLFQNNGTYHITLTVTDINGCSDSQIKFNYVTIGQPTASFVADTTTATCPPLTVNFTDQSSPDVTRWFWNFGDGSTSTLPNPSKVYAVAGTYDVSLVVENAQGCRDTLQMDDLIDISGPTGTFTFSPTTGCLPLTVGFNVSSPNVNWTYEWDFGDGVGGFGTNTSHTYLSDTTATPTLIITDEFGCRVLIPSATRITIQPLPDVTFNVSATDICLGQVISLSNTSTSNRPITDFLWDFGDGTTSTVPNPSHTYTDTGTYYVNLLATTLDGCQDTATTPIEITVTSPPTAFFQANPDEGCRPLPVGFVNSSFGDFPLTSWAWNFGDGNSASGSVILPHTYSIAGIYQATLTVTDTRGCTGEMSRSVTVNDLPPVDFSAFRYGCAPISVDFTDLTLGASPAVAWLWNFGDGLTSIQQNPTHIYANDGNYTVSLTVTDANGCVNTLSRANYIRLEHPIANFSSNAGITCPPQTVQFTDLSAPDTTISWLWTFGDGSAPSTLQNPQHTYHSSDTFDVQLIITNIFGCADTMFRPQHVITYAPPSASFTVSDSAACVPKNIVFTSTSTPSGAPLATYQWDFGTGAGTINPTTSFLYTNAGTYTARLIIADVNGCKDTAFRSMYIHPNPQADFFAGDTAGCAVTAINFFDQSTGANAPVAWAWNFGDGTFGSTQNPVNTYFADGVYSVSLLVTDVNGCQDSLTRTNYIKLDHPTAAFTTNKTQSCIGTMVNFTDQSFGPANVVGWLWDFGDGGPNSSLQNPSHAYNSAGSYDVSLVITDEYGCQDTLIRTTLIQVYTDPLADFTYAPPLGCDPLSVNFQATPIAGSAPIVAYAWDFGNGSNTLITNPTNLFNGPGTYAVTLTVTDGNGCQDSVAKSVQVLPKPLVDFSADLTRGCGPQTVQFSDLTNSTFAKVSWLWDFGDGSTSTSPSPVHTYASDGVYDVSLIVTDLNGCVDSLTKLQYIQLSHPTANFSFNQTVVCPNVPIGVSFTDETLADTTLSSWLWHFGDGGTSTLQNPSHSYTTTGTYNISLIVTNVLGCSDTITLPTPITVLDPPVPVFSMSDTANCTPLTIVFGDLSTPGDAAISTWSWNFGDGGTSLQANPTHTWTSAGVYTAQLTLTDLNGCQASDSVVVEAYELPVANFVSPDTLGCAPQTVAFTDLTTTPYLISSWLWDFGDGNTSTQKNPVHTYASDGVYSVSLTVTDANGCVHAITKSNYIRLTHPVANFSMDQFNGCPGTIVQFGDLSTQDHPLVSWLWDFGDGTTATQQSPSHPYHLPGTFSIRLIVENTFGCRDTLLQPAVLTIFQAPIASTIPGDTANCMPLTLDWESTSTPGSAALQSFAWDYGDGSTAIGANPPAHTYLGAGIYQTSLLVSDANACLDTMVHTVEAYAGPQANLGVSTTLACPGALLQFTDLSAGPYPVVGWLWDFGDGTSSTQQHPQHVYANMGIYDISLIVTDINGCTEIISVNQYIEITRPQAAFTTSITELCPGDMVQFTDVSVVDTTIISWAWDFGDGTTSSQQNPSHLYSNTGTYSVQLIIVNALGCSDTIVQPSLIEVATRPNALFAIGDDAGCVPHSTGFTNLSVPATWPIASYAWDFGNGQTSGLQNPAMSYPQAGNYPVSLVVTDQNGCTDTAVASVVAYELPQANFAGVDSAGCASQTVNFLNSSTAVYPFTSFIWSFGDGNSSSQQFPSHTYLNDGTYDVSLLVIDANGCRDSLTKLEHIQLSHPVADFSLDQNQVCAGTNSPIGVSFTDESVADTTLSNWLWHFGDGTTSTLQNPSHAYTTSGTYNISLIITNVLGCTDTITQSTPITVLAAPVLAFSMSDTTNCTPLSINFGDLSSPGDAAISTWSWSFGDGTTSAQTSPSHNWNTPGVYTVSLTLTDLNGCQASDSVVVEAYEIPVANFVSPDTLGCAPQTVAFTDLTSTPYLISSWLWDFGDGNTSTQQNPVHTYANDGVYSVSLTVTDENGCVHSASKPNYIRLTHPVANFSLDQFSGCPGTTVQFNDLSTPDHPLVSWMWDFGDGTTSLQQNPSHTYGIAGVYSIQLVVENDLGCRDTLLQPALLNIFQAPTASTIPGDTANCMPLILDWESTSTPGSAALQSFVWDYGDGNTAIGANPPSHTYLGAGIYQTSLIVSDANGCRDTALHTVEVYSGPQADLGVSTTLACPNALIQFTDFSNGPYPVVGWLWNFGDGNTSTQQHPLHAYTNTGVYDISLTVTDINGCTETINLNQYIEITLPQAAFTSNVTEVCPGDMVQFTDVSVVDTTIVSWTWDFGDGSSSSQQNPTHLYGVTGSYSVQLIIINALGCSDTIVQPSLIEVAARPDAQFAIGDDAGCTPHSTGFTNLSVPATWPIASYAWDFGNGQTSGLQNPAASYSQAGNYPVSLVVTDQNGCTDTATASVVSYELPQAAFAGLDSIGCSPQTVNFLNSSSAAYPFASFSWNFGDGNNSSLQFPSHTYTNDGTYDVSLLVVDVNGCRDSLTKVEHIRLSHPEADFSVDQEEVCPGTMVNFADASKPDTTIQSRLWDFGDGTTSTLQNPTHFYALAGDYDVSLTITNILGCANTKTIPMMIEVLTPPSPAFVVSDSQGCAPHGISIQDASVAGDAAIVSWLWDLGNGDSAVAQNPTAFYLNPGSYVINLLTTDANGCEAETSQTVEVFERPTADFFSTDTLGCAEFTSFFDLTTSPHNLVGWKWYFGDGDSAMVQNPVHTYDVTGTYTVSLIVYDQWGCSDTISKPNYIQLTRPIAAFSQDLDVVCPGSPFQFIDQSIPDHPLVSWFWDFGDGTTANVQNPTHTFSSPGTYSVSLVITNIFGCTDTETGEVEVLVPPQAQFVPLPAQGCDPLTVAFDESSISFSSPLFSWEWNFGDATTSLQQEPTHTYNTPGSYLVSLRVLDGNGCFHDTTTVVEVFAVPMADFVANPQTGCAPATINFTSLATGAYALANWEWDFGDGTTGSGATTSHTYAADGVYDVELIVTDVNGCRDTLARSQYIRLSHPVADFSWTPSLSCPGLSVNFTDQSTADTTLMSWLWDFGDGTTSTAQNPVHVYNTPGQYSVSLTITNVRSCSDAEVKTNIIEVATPPVAEFVPADTAGCQPLLLQFFQQSSPGSSNLVNYSWDFGDGGSSSQPNPGHIFTQAGSFQVELTITDANGCQDTVSHSVNARPLPTPAFVASDSFGCSPITITFFDQTVGGAGIASWLWDFGDGTTANTQFANHTYVADGVYTVSLTITDVFGCSGTTTKPQYIRLNHPTADFSQSDTQTCPGTIIQFQDLSNSDTTITNWWWSFGDGSTSNLQNPTHTYTDSGMYSISLIVENVFGCRDTIVQNSLIDILTGPVAQYTAPSLSGCAPFTIAFTNTSFPTANPINSWLWDFGDGSTSIFTNPSHTFNDPSTYTVSLIALDSYGCSDTFTQTVTVFEAPTPQFIASERFGCAPKLISFLDQSGQGTAPIMSWAWDFGDGNTSNQQFPAHTYANDGTYDVSLVLTDANGCQDSLARPQYIQLDHPVADFTVSSNQICPGTYLSFQDASIPDTTLIGWLWDFGDGTSSSDQNAIHAYSIGGTYTVSLTVTNVLGCSHTVSIPAMVEILPAPTPFFTIGDLEGCTPFSTTFTDNSIGNSSPLVNWLWEFGDGDSSTAPNASHTFQLAGTYPVSLTVTDNNGCQATHTQSVQSLELPQVNFLSVDTVDCAPHSAQFTDLSSASSPIMGWAWSFGDGGISSQQFPVHLYTQDGLFDVQLSVTDQKGCVGTGIKPAYIRLSNPDAQIGMDTTIGCPGLAVNFSDLSIPDTTLLSWFWEFGDGTTSNVQNPSHLYQNPGSYTVQLTVTNVLGCSDTETLSQAVTISTPPVAGIGVAGNSGCVPFEVDFLDQSVLVSSPIVSWNWDFGNGANSSQQQPSYTFAQAGTFTVELTIVDAIGCASTDTEMISATAPPIADFAANDSMGCAPKVVQFTNFSSGSFPIVSHFWDFGDGTTSNQQHPSHQYVQDGFYSVQLIVTDFNGCQDTLMRPQYIRLSHPTADFSVNQANGCTGETFSFVDESIGDTTLAGWLWDFGDGNVSVDQFPTHSYSAAGSYDVSLMVTNIFGCRDTISYPGMITIFQGPSPVILASDTSACVPMQVTLTNQSSSPYGILNWQWFEDGIPVGQSMSINRLYGTAGDYEVVLLVRDVNGCADSVSQMIHARPLPVADFTFSDSVGCGPAVVSFGDLTAHTPSNWLWEFGDGNTSNVQNPIHTYDADGIYSVKLTVIDQYGCSDEKERINLITLAHPEAFFTVDYDLSCPPIEATFVARGTGLRGIAKWEWDFGDGSTVVSLQDTVIHNFAAAGIYDVNLTATDSMGCIVIVSREEVIEVLANVIPTPLDIHAVSVLHDEQVEVRFAAFDGDYFQLYTIYREEPGNGFVPIYTTEYLSDTVYIDTAVDARNNSYCYKITVTNFCGSESPLAATPQHCTIEARATALPGQIVVEWNPYQGWPVEQYEVYKVEGYGPLNVSFLGIVPGNTNRFVEPFEDCFNQINYRIKAVGSDMLQTSWSDTTQVYSETGVLGRSPAVIRATVVNNEEALFEWKPIDMRGLSLMRIERAVDGGDFEPLASLPAGETKFQDRDVKVDQHAYGYRLSAQDSCGNQSPLSVESHTMLLSLSKDGGTNVLSWTPYHEWQFGVQTYRIEVFNDTIQQWQTVDEVQGNVTTFADKIITFDQAYYCYRVWATELGGNEATSLSNEVCVRVETAIEGPNAFTPNGDGINDEFFLSGFHVKTINLQIYSRWGMKLFESNSIDEGWDGTFRGAPVKEGVYVYVARGIGNNGSTYVRQGSITLFR